jgi:cellulase/cellobiase CelA1
LVDDATLRDPIVDCASEEVPGGDLTGVFIPSTDWGGGYCGEVVITNTGTTATADWVAVLELNGAMIKSYNQADIWNLDSTGLSGSIAVSPQTPWAQVIQPGQTSYSLGFCAERPQGDTSSSPTLTSVARYSTP